MSLTRLLERRGGAVREFFELRLQDLRFMQEEWLDGGAPTLLPNTPVVWSLVGAGLDYRIRYLFTVTPPQQFVAVLGGLAGRGLRAGFVNLTKDLSALVAAHDPRGRLLPDEIEEELGRYCYLLAMYESLYRSSAAKSPLLELPPASTTGRQLDLVPVSDAADLLALSGAAVETLESLFGRPVVANPTFAGTADVRGADADLIVDGCLIEIKTTKKRTLNREAIYQLLGYVLLDYEDEFDIQRVGFYGSRVPLLIDWPVHKLVAALSVDTETVASLRAGLRGVLENLPGRTRSAPRPPSARNYKLC